MIRKLSQYQIGQAVRVMMGPKSLQQAGTPPWVGLILGCRHRFAFVGRPQQPLYMGNAADDVGFRAVGWVDDWRKVVEKIPRFAGPLEILLAVYRMG